MHALRAEIVILSNMFRTFLASKLLIELKLAGLNCAMFGFFGWFRCRIL
jgi:hypothetical protein